MLLFVGCSNKPKILTINDVEKSFQIEGLKLTEQEVSNDPKINSIYNNVAPTKIFEDNQINQNFKVYIYPSTTEMEMGLKEFQDEQSKDMTYGLKETVFKVDNLMFIGKLFSEETVKALKKAETAAIVQRMPIKANLIDSRNSK